MGNFSRNSEKTEYFNNTRLIRYRFTFRIATAVVIQPSAGVIRRGVVTLIGRWDYTENRRIITTLEVWARLVPINHEVKRRKLI